VGPPEARVLDRSTIGFRATDPLESFTGHAPVAAATLRVDPAHPATARGSLTVRADAITTGNLVRDRNAARGVFQVGRYPVIRYTIADVQADPTELPSGGTARLVVTGTLTLHGTTRRVVARGTVVRHADRLDAKLHFDVRLSEFGMDRPRFLFIRVDDLVAVQVDLAVQSSVSP
jgi:polyisoprenoid-binding protein YceI